MSAQATGRAAVFQLLEQSGDLGGFLSRTWAASLDSRQSKEVFAGAVGGLIDCVATLRAGGVRLAGWPPKDAEFLRQPSAVLAADLGAAINASEPTEDMRHKISLLANFAASARAQGALHFPKQKAQAANVQKVEIVGLPDRVTTTDIRRDGDGNITESVQTERDL